MIKLILVYSKILRSFYNGLFSALLLYLFYNSLNYQQPIRLSLMIFGSLITSIIKSMVIQNSIQKRQVNRSLIYSFLFYLMPIIIFTICHIKNISEGIAYILFIVAGFFPVDGEDGIVFQKLQEKYILNGQGQHQTKNTLKYFRLGYIFQAIGSICPFLYLTYHVYQVNYVNQLKVKLLMTFCLVLAFINLSFYAFFQLQSLKQPKKEIQQQNRQKQSFNINHDDTRKLKIVSITDGIYYGLLSAPFIVYYLDLKLNLYQDVIGIIIFSFFLLKGVGQDIMEKNLGFKKLFRCWSILANCLLTVSAIFPLAKLSVISFIIAFPMWNYSKVFRRKYIQEKNYERIKFLQNIKYWEKLGIAIGVFISSFFFTILSTKFYFGYPLFLCGVLGLVKIFFIQPFYQNSRKNAQFTTQFQLPTQTTQIMQQKQPLKTLQIPHNTNQPNLQKKSSFVYIFLCTIFFAIIIFYIYASYFGNMNIALTTRGDKFKISQKLTIVNQSFAHYLVRENITNVKLVNCDQVCVGKYQKLKGKDYQNLKFHGPDYQWLYFPFLPYYSRIQQVVNEVQSVLIQNHKVKGFSLIWSNPLQYNKMPSFIDQYLLTMPQKYGFYYSQMPSLNLRIVQNRIIMIFTRTKRIKSQLPSFIKKQPPTNILAIQLTFKLLTHYRYIREYILYHLNMGVDKFFIYDNNRNPNDQYYYQEYHQVDRFLKKCTNEPIDGQYAILEEILEDFYDHVVYIPWKIGQLHPQGQAHLHYRCFYQNIVKFTSFTDMDQYLFSPTGKYIPDTLQSLLQKQITAIIISSQSFKTRICMHRQLSIQQYRFLHQPQNLLTIKTIALTRLLVDHSIHDKSVKNGRYAYLLDEKPDIIMYHYTVYGVDDYLPEVKKYDWDYSLRPMVEGMKEACKGKCSDKIELTCTDQEYQIEKIDFCKELE